MRTVLHTLAQNSIVGILGEVPLSHSQRRIITVGTGFYIEPDLLVTVKDVVKPQQELAGFDLRVIGPDEVMKSVRIVRIDEKSRLALLMLKTGETHSPHWLTVSRDPPPDPNWPVRIYGFDFQRNQFNYRQGTFQTNVLSCSCSNPTCGVIHGASIFTLPMRTIVGWTGAPVINSYTGNVLTAAWGCPDDKSDQLVGTELRRMQKFLQAV